MENIEVNAIKSEIFSEQKSQVTELGGDGLLNDQELEAICGGQGGSLIDIDIPGTINAVTDSAARVYRGFQGFGRTAYHYVMGTNDG